MQDPTGAKSASPNRKALLVLGALVVALPLIGLLMWGVFVGYEADLEPGDRKLVLTSDDLTVFDPQLVPGPDKITRTEFIDGSWVVESEYESDALYVYTSLNHEPTERDARAVYTGIRAAAPLMAGLEEGVTLEDRDDLFRWGDTHHAKAFMYNGEPTGVAVFARRGKSVITVSIGGWIFENADQLHALLDPWLRRLPH